MELLDKDVIVGLQVEATATNLLLRQVIMFSLLDGPNADVVRYFYRKRLA